MESHTKQQDLLRTAWLEGSKAGSLPAREQAKAWALREVWKASGKGEFGMKTYIAGKLAKNTGESPSSEAVRKLFERIDADDDWFPGKANYAEVGAPGVLVGSKTGLPLRSVLWL